VGRNPAADPNFAGFGQFLTGASGRYKFRTIRAGLYTGRTRHFHWGITIPGQLSRFTTQTYWSGESGNANDGVLNGISDAAQKASVILTYTAVPGTTTGEVQTTWDFLSSLTPVEPAYPGGGGLVVAGAAAAGPAGGNARYRITVTGATGYTYELYGNSTLADLGWQALPFSMSHTGAIDRNQYSATADGPLSFYVEEKASTGFYYVSYRVPGANTGTP